MKTNFTVCLTPNVHTFYNIPIAILVVVHNICGRYSAIVTVANILATVAT